MSASELNAQQAASVQLVRAADVKRAKLNQVVDLINMGGRFQVEHWRAGKLIGNHNIKNGIVNEGKNKLLNVMFDGATQITQWYLGMIALTGFTALAATDTYDDINQVANGWDEFTNYTDANNGASAVTRPEWPTDPASAQSITNSTVAIYDITGAGGTVKGIFAVGGGAAPQTKGDHAPGSTLWATALFTSGDVVTLVGDQLKVTYSVSA
jgi:hypothetical protein